jgi:ubiquinone/menaquinone biosynthesis C-methylase UbiE
VGTDAKDAKKVAARRWFDRRAARYGTGRGSGWLAMVQGEAFGALELRAGDRLLDVGCGPGAAVLQAAPLVERAVGVDLSEQMIQRARKAAGDVANVEFRVADSELLPFEDDAFTAVLCSTSFHHYPNPGRAVREMARVLVPDGRFVLADASADLRAARVADVFLRRLEPGHVRLYRSTELAAFVQDAGFVRARMRRLSGGGYVIVAARRPPTEPA